MRKVTVICPYEATTPGAATYSPSVEITLTAPDDVSDEDLARHAAAIAATRIARLSAELGIAFRPLDKVEVRHVA